MRSSFSKYFFQFAIGFLVGILFPAWFWWIFLTGSWEIAKHPSLLHTTSFLVAIIVFTFNLFSFYYITKFPGHKVGRLLLYTISLWYFVAFLFLLFFRLPYSLSFLISSFTVSGALFYIYYFYAGHAHDKIHYIPFGRVGQLEKIPQVQWVALKQPVLPQPPPQSIVADLHSPALNSQWQKFLAACTLQGIPVYNVRQVEESLSGRIKIEHMYENDLGSLLPSAFYLFIKQALDILLVVFFLPLLLPVLLLVALAIKLESKGPILFVQKRVGIRGREFTMYKFRSMRQDAEKDGAKFAAADDNRITKFGKILRKFRIDELPQVVNILKCEMSFIGPRPEQKFFVDRFEEEIPFYNYRHIVKPGISGWAQVMQGYAADTEATQLKIQYDFFYIKNFSFSLDLLIFFKTLKTVLTGFGVR